VNEGLGWLLGALFPGSFSLLRAAHLVHHGSNRNDRELIEFVKPQESKALKTLHYYLCLLGVFWVGTPRPNPCPGSAVIAYNLPEEERVVVKLYTVDGRLARILCDENQKRGPHVLRIQGDFRPGLYFLRLDAGEHRAVRKMAR